MVAFAKGGILFDRSKGVDNAVITDNNIVFNIRARSNGNIIADSCTGSNKGSTVYGISH